MSFSEEEDMILIDNIKLFEVLYNNAHEMYNDYTFKTVVWKSIAMKIGKTGE